METTTDVTDESVRARWRGKDGPQRRYELSINIGADDEVALRKLFQILATQIRRGDIASNTGGSNCQGTFAVVVNADQTAEKYQEEMDQWLKANQAYIEPNVG